jgi:hypothetical protein
LVNAHQRSVVANWTRSNLLETPILWSGTQELRGTADGGKTWTRLSELEKSPCDVFSLRQNDVAQRLVCVFHDGSIHSTGLNGEWTLERVVY